MSRNDSRTRVSVPSWASRTLFAALRAAGLRAPSRDLPWVIQEVQDATSPDKRALALAELFAWIRGPAFAPVGSDPEDAIGRLGLLLDFLDRDASARAAVSRLLTSVLRDSEGPSLFAQTELSEQGGLFSEFARRVADQVLPPSPRLHELGYALEVAVTSQSDAEWISAIDDEQWRRVCALAEGLDASSLIDDLREAVLHAAIQAAAIGLSPEVRGRAGGFSAATLSRAAGRWRDVGGPAETAALTDAIERARRSIDAAYASVESRGVSLSLVYRLEAMAALLRRLEVLMRALEEGLPEAERRRRAHAAFVAAVRSRLARKSVRALLEMNFDVFARRLVQHAGETGEHYIARDRRALRAALLAGAGGGVVTVATCLIKFEIYALSLPLFFGGLFVWANYSGSFMAMQFLGFSLATKQPSMTSAALADKLSRRMDASKLAGFVEEIATIARSQFMAAAGNVGFVVPGAWLACLAYEAVAGKPFLSAAEAEHALQSLHPWRSGTIAYAALTGALLWISSFGAGYVQNWIVFRSLPEAIAQHRGLRAVFGVAFARRFGAWLARNASGVGGNLAIGFLLAFVPVAGKFFGLPLDIRHVTLSAGTIAIAFRSLDGAAVGWSEIAVYAGSVAAIGALNFGVSTACALAVAARARRVRRAWLRAVLAYAGREFLRRPWRFFLPPREMA